MSTKTQPLSATMPGLVPTPILSTTVIDLLVGEKRYHTTIATLTRESKYFQETLVNDLMSMGTDMNGTLCVDADSETFDHVLRYLRHGVYPIFYHAQSGHDFALYLNVLQQAKQFRIPDLVKWIEEKKYLEAVKLEYSVSEQTHLKKLESTVKSDEEIVYHSVYETKTVYRCPRNIEVHWSHEQCGKGCMEKEKNLKKCYKEEGVWVTTVTKKKIVVDQDMCIKRTVKRAEKKGGEASEGVQTDELMG